MHAVQLVRLGAPLEDRVLPDPAPGVGDVVVAVRAAGICRSDVHYRRGPHTVDAFPMTLGHEIAGEVVAVGEAVATHQIGDRVCIHYQTSCGACVMCHRGSEQFCRSGVMFGKGRDGGYAEYVLVPARNAFHLPGEVGFEHGAVMMCSSATSFHALRKGRLRPGETVAVFGCGGLGMSAIQIAGAWGAGRVLAVDVNPAKLQLAARHGAEPIDAAAADPVGQIRDATAGAGVDLALELLGLALTVRQSVEVLGLLGRAVVVGIGTEPIELVGFADLVVREAEVIGSADHLAQEIPELLQLAVSGRLRLDGVVGNVIPLQAAGVNAAMDAVEANGDVVRNVIVPGGA